VVGCLKHQPGTGLTLARHGVTLNSIDKRRRQWKKKKGKYLFNEFYCEKDGFRQICRSFSSNSYGPPVATLHPSPSALPSAIENSASNRLFITTIYQVQQAPRNLERPLSLHLS
jgi:hypothetical protein